MHAVEITHFTKRYDKKGTLAVNNISLTVERGDFFGFLGPNGAGKSTTIHCLTGISMPTSGTLKVFGYDVVKDYRSARTQVGLSPQEFNADFFAPVASTLDTVAGYFGMRTGERKKRVDEVIERFALAPHRDKPFRSLSGGMKRRVMLARALVHNPDLLILDEPTAGVDVELRKELWKYFRELNEEGKTIILTSHYLEEVEELTKSIAIIHNGTIVAQAPTADFLKDGTGLEEKYLALTASDQENTYASR